MAESMIEHFPALRTDNHLLQGCVSFVNYLSDFSLSCS